MIWIIFTIWCIFAFVCAIIENRTESIFGGVLLMISFIFMLYLPFMV